MSVCLIFVRTCLLCLVLLGASNPAMGGNKESLPALSLPDASKCDDLTYLRRVWVVLAGRTAPAAEVVQLLNQQKPLDRHSLVDRLLNSPQYAETWGRWLTYLTGCDDELLSPGGFAMQVPRERLFWLWQKWLQDQVAEDTGYDQIIWDLIVSDSRAPSETLSTYTARYSKYAAAMRNGYGGWEDFKNGPNDLFWKTYRTPSDNAELICRNLLGFRMECARCHDHPLAAWTMDDHKGLAAVFQRVVYAELPVTRGEKRRVVMGFGLLAVATELSFIGIALALRHRRYTSLAAFTIMLASLTAAVATYTVLNHLHLLTGVTRWESAGLMSALSKQSEVMTWIVAVIMSLAGIALLLAQYFQFRRSGRMQSIVLSFLTGLVGGILLMASLDLGFAALRPGNAVSGSLTSVMIRNVRLRLMTAAQPPAREVYDDTNGNYQYVGAPRLLDGTLLADSADDHPREQFADWLRTESDHQLARSLVNRVLLRVLNSACVWPVDDFRPGIEQQEPELLEQMTSGFVQQEYSLKWLLRELVLSDRFQVVSGDLSDSVVFRSRDLTGEEILASCNQLHPTLQLALADRWSPTPGNPYSCSSFEPNYGTVADQLVSASLLQKHDSNLPFQAVSVLLVGPDVLDYATRLSAALCQDRERMPLSFEDVCLGLWGRPCTTSEAELLLTGESGRAEGDSEVLATAIWAAMNCSDFLTLD